MAVCTWDGGSIFNNNLSEKSNWQGDVAPNPSDDLVFPAGLGFLDRALNNDFAPLTSFGNITFSGGDYDLSGNRMLLKGDITNAPTDNVSKPNEVKLDISFSAASHTISIDGPGIKLSGALSNEDGAGQLTFRRTSGTGTIVLDGTTSNTYNQPTFVENGARLLLEKDPNIRAISGRLTLKPGSAVDSIAAGQLKPNLSIHMDAGSFAEFDRELFGPLTLEGATLVISGQSTLNGTVTETTGGSSVSHIDTSNGGSLRLTSTGNGTRVFDVAGVLNLSIALSSGNLRKSGDGTLLLNAIAANNSFSKLEIDAGTVFADPNANFVGIPGDVEIGGGATPAKLDLGVPGNNVADTSSILVRTNGTLIASDSSSEKVNSLTVDGGSLEVRRAGNLTVTSALTVAAGEIRLSNIGDSALQPGKLVINGLASLQGTTRIEAGRINFNGGLTMTGGLLDASGPNSIARLTGKLTTNANAAAATIKGTLELSNGNHTLEVADGSADKDLLINAVIQNTAGTPASIIKTGPGKLELKGNNTYTGNTTLNAGIMLVQGQNSATQGSYTVNGGELGGGGAISRLVVGNAVVSPGDASSGFLRVLNSTAFGFNATYVANLDGPNSPLFDQIRTNALFLDHATNPERRPILDPRVSFDAPISQNFRVIDIPGSTPIGADQFFQSLEGEVLTQGKTFTASNQNFTINYFGGDGNDIVLTRNTGPAFANRKITPEITEGQTAFITGHITEPDANDTFFLDVDWGDGRQQTFTFLPGSPKDIKVGHRYLDNPRDDDHYDVKLLWRDQHGGQNTAELETIVRNKAPILGQITASLPPFTVGQPITIRSSVTDAPLDTFKVHVRWDLNGPWQAINLPAGTKFFQLKHTYAKAGDHHVTILLIDDDLDIDELSFLLHVS